LTAFACSIALLMQPAHLHGVKVQQQYINITGTQISEEMDVPPCLLSPSLVVSILANFIEVLQCSYLRLEVISGDAALE